MHQDQNIPSASEKARPLQIAKERLLDRNRGTADQRTSQQSYESENRYYAVTDSNGGGRGDPSSAVSQSKALQDTAVDGETDTIKDTSETIATSNDPRQKRKNMKTMKRDNGGRKVTDPVTHLPVTIHDSTDAELKSVPENEVSAGFAGSSGDRDRSNQERNQQQAAHRGMDAVFPPPSLEASGKQLAAILNSALTAGLSFLLAALSLLLLAVHLYHANIRSARNPEQSHGWPYLVLSCLTLVLIEVSVGTLVIWGLRVWATKKVLAVWEDGIWDAARAHEQENSKSSMPESVQWLNSFLTSVWPLINPDLFTSLADTLEDVMQASLPKMVRMISVEDLGQGNEALRILGINWLPAGDAKEDVSVRGQVRKSSQAQESDRKVPNEGEVSKDSASCNNDEEKDTPEEQGTKSGAEKSSEEQAVAEGMEAEEGDFVNVELGLSYRASSTGKSMKVKAKNAHLYLVFYLPGGIRFRTYPVLLCSSSSQKVTGP